MDAGLVNRGGDAVTFFCRHLLGLGVTYKWKNEVEAHLPLRFATYSGTLIEIEGIIYFLTAGHCLHELKERLASDQLEIINAVLMDTLGPEPADHHPIPFDLKSATPFYVDDEELGLDFGIIPLSPHHVRLLSKNKMVALSGKNWLHQSKIEFDGYAMLGLPSKLTSERLTKTGDGFVSPVLIGVQKANELPAGKDLVTCPWFTGKISIDRSHSIEGMSGGPIFGFKREPNGRMRYWVVALQSRWDRPTGTIYGCSLPLLGSLMTKWTRDYMSSQVPPPPPTHTSA